jgi:hypothetical protein
MSELVGGKGALLLAQEGSLADELSCAATRLAERLADPVWADRLIDLFDEYIGVRNQFEAAVSDSIRPQMVQFVERHIAR